jgi:uncharacterized protein (DUF4415 family)
MRKEYDLKTLKVVRRGIHPELHHAMKQRITIALDQDIIEFFKTLARTPGGLPYQTQVNQALREYVQQISQNKEEKDLTTIKMKLLKDPKFINAIAKQIEQ